VPQPQAQRLPVDARHDRQRHQRELRQRPGERAGCERALGAGEPGGEGEPGAAAGAVEQTPVFWKMKPVETRPPVYPPRCLRMGIEGTVRVRVLVGEDGRVQEVTVGKSSGETALDDAAMDAVRYWRFEPAKRDGVPVRAWAIVPIEFKLID